MGNYRLTNAAARDFGETFDFGIGRFGLAQAESYQREMIKQFSRTAESPFLYPAIEHIRQGYRRCVFRSNAIYYKVEDMGILIVRILGRQNLEDALLNEG